MAHAAAAPCPLPTSPVRYACVVSCRSKTNRMLCPDRCRTRTRPGRGLGSSGNPYRALVVPHSDGGGGEVVAEGPVLDMLVNSGGEVLRAGKVLRGGK